VKVFNAPLARLITILGQTDFGLITVCVWIEKSIDAPDARPLGRTKGGDDFLEASWSLGH
jgi:hypothetical protein